MDKKTQGRTAQIKATHAQLDAAIIRLAQAHTIGDATEISEATESVGLAGAAHREALAVKHMPECVFCGKAEAWDDRKMVRFIITHVSYIQDDPESDSGFRVVQRQLVRDEIIEQHATRSAMIERFGIDVDSFDKELSSKEGADNGERS